MSIHEEQQQQLPREPRSDPSPDLRLHSIQPQPQPQQQQPQRQQPQPQEQLSPGRSWHFNAVFAGPSRVGKTKLIRRFAESQFSDGYAETTEAAPVSKAVAIGRHHVLFQCWDTPGADTLTNGLEQELRYPHVLFVLFDVSRDTAAELERWCRLAGACGPPRPLLVLAGNKSDLGVHSETLARARELGQLEDGLLFVLSVLADDENVEVDTMMLEVGKALTERHSLALLPPPPLTMPVGPQGEVAAPDASGGDSKERGKRGDDGKPQGQAARLRELLTSWPYCCCPCCF